MRTEPRRITAWWRKLPLVLLLTVSACATVPHTGRNQFNVVSDAQLNELALKVFDEIGSKEPASTDKRLEGIVRRVVDRVSKAAENLDRPAYQWDVKVIDKDIPNAFCLPGGKIVIYSGIVPYAKNEAGLATVVAHEVAHAVARHGGERLSQKLALRGAVTAGGEVLKGKDGKLDPKAQIALGALGMGATIGVVLPYSRLHELEADRIGQIYLAKAGYDPTAAIHLWDRMAKIKKPPIPVWLSTHPADEERIEKLKESLPETMKYYDAATPKYGKGVPL